ncbi:Oidioi.mRNA.OKI2018_I69.PAR.g10245.t1.cds [Oikopleura dioica]|uniref:Oidioi.mRNA.OKI2018_I69.PAR.g10245.t1.cds n=1 Tax=Oikopleura dioica TaxID=34765 RepID=A0ABN7RTS5_OIKDI|nr:Oidioi.mRNA.OKI2018_I69.PAR.g10245.t1.cds [Oikopleura dioica]
MKRYCEGLFNPTSGCVVEIYRNSLLEETDTALLRYRKPFGYAEITMQSVEENILQRMEDGVCFTNIPFRQIHLQGPVLPKLKVAFRLLQRESSFQLEPATIGQLLSIDVVSLLNLRMGNSSGRRKGRRDQVEDAPYPTDSAVSDLLARAYEEQSGQPGRDLVRDLSPSPSQLRRASLNEHERQQRALMRMSADLLAERKHSKDRETLEDQKFELEEQLNRMQRDLQLRHTLVHDGLEGAAPDEIASRFMVMREKYKTSLAANEKLKEKLREVSDSITRGEGQKNNLLNELKRASDQSDKHLEELNRMSRRLNMIRTELVYLPEKVTRNKHELLKDQKKLEDLCKEQERIISKLEELFAKTRVNVDTRWKDDVDRLMHATKTREKYTPGNYALPQYSAVPGLAPPNSKALPGYHMQEEIETERMRTAMLERQINEMAREHAREKQDLVNRIEEIRRTSYREKQKFQVANLTF